LIFKSFLIRIKNYFIEIYLNFRGSFVATLELYQYLIGKGQSRKQITERYPDPISSKTVADLPAKSRGVLENDIEQCTGCLKCLEICPTGCFEIESEEGPTQNKTWVSIFNIDHSLCIQCELCVHVCQPRSLRFTKKFETSVLDRSQLVMRFGKGFVTHDQRQKWNSLRKLEDINFYDTE
tara:strand:+ start:2505 stop:3044 length:540 start_codon:yes stop_codon:yes gene_type:complete